MLKGSKITLKKKGCWKYRLVKSSGKSDKIVALQVELTDSVDSLKVKIQSRLCIPAEKQRLLYSGKSLEDGTLGDYNIVEDSMLYVVGRLSRVAPCTIQILMFEENLTFHVSLSDTVQKTKAEIMKRMGIPLHQQTLLYIGKDLKNSSRLSDYNIESGSMLTLVVLTQMQIFIKCLDGKTLSLDVEPIDTIKSLKVKIENKTHQRLMFVGIELDDDGSLADYKIQNKAILRLLYDRSISELVEVESMSKIFVKYTDKLLSLDVEPLDTIKSLKVKIHHLEGLYLDEQRLVFAGEELDNDKTLTGYNIHDKAMIRLFYERRSQPTSLTDQTTVNVESTIKIFVKTSTGKTLSLDVESIDTIRCIKLKIQHLEGFFLDQQRLMLAGKELDNTKTVSGYQIHDKAILRLLQR